MDCRKQFIHKSKPGGVEMQYVLIICLVRGQIVWCFSLDILVAKDGFIHKCWVFAVTMSKWERLCDRSQTEWASGWASEHVFMCFYLMSVLLWLTYAPHAFFGESSVQSLHLYCPCSSLSHLHAFDLFTQQNKCPSLHGLEAVTSCLGLFLWQQREGKT